GPDNISLLGMFQPIGDGLKLLLKEIIIPYKADKFLFIVAPIISFSFSLVNILNIPQEFFFVYSILIDFDSSLLLIFAISSFSVYGVILAGWSSNSKYSLLGSIRSSAQII